MRAVRGIISDTLLMGALKVLPWGSPDRIDLLFTLSGYLKRSIARNQSACLMAEEAAKGGKG